MTAENRPRGLPSQLGASEKGLGKPQSLTSRALRLRAVTEGDGPALTLRVQGAHTGSGKR